MPPFSCEHSIYQAPAGRAGPWNEDRTPNRVLLWAVPELRHLPAIALLDHHSQWPHFTHASWVLTLLLEILSSFSQSSSPPPTCSS